MMFLAKNPSLSGKAEADEHMLRYPNAAMAGNIYISSYTVWRTVPRGASVGDLESMPVAAR